MSSNNSITFDKPLKRISLHYSGNTFSEPKDLEARLKQSFEAGKESALSECESNIANYRKEADVLENIQAEFQNLTQAINQRVPEIILYLLKNTLGNIEWDAAKIETLIKDTLLEVADSSEKITLRLSESDLELLRNANASLLSQYDNIHFEGDSELGQGDCLIKTNFGIIDATLNTKLNKISEELKSE